MARRSPGSPSARASTAAVLATHAEALREASLGQVADPRVAVALASDLDGLGAEADRRGPGVVALTLRARVHPRARREQREGEGERLLPAAPPLLVPFVRFNVSPHQSTALGGSCRKP